MWDTYASGRVLVPGDADFRVGGTAPILCISLSTVGTLGYGVESVASPSDCSRNFVAS